MPGINGWSINVKYSAGTSVLAADGNIYLSIADNLGANPTVNSSVWRKTSTIGTPQTGSQLLDAELPVSLLDQRYAQVSIPGPGGYGSMFGVDTSTTKTITHGQQYNQLAFDECYIFEDRSAHSSADNSYMQWPYAGNETPFFGYKQPGWYYVEAFWSFNSAPNGPVLVSQYGRDMMGNGIGAYLIPNLTSYPSSALFGGDQMVTYLFSGSDGDPGFLGLNFDSRSCTVDFTISYAGILLFPLFQLTGI